MFEQAGGTRRGAGRCYAAGIVSIVLLAAALTGFLVGVFGPENAGDVTWGLLFAPALLLSAAGAAAGAWWWVRRQAAGFGLSAGRYLKVSRGIRRGQVPEDPVVLPAAIDIVRRQRRMLSAQQRRWAWWLMGGAALLLLVSAVAQVLDHRYGLACLNLLVMGVGLINPFLMRRQRRRVNAVEQALGLTQQPQAPSSAVEVPPRRPGP
ncbi:hypothetical protein ABZ686_08840 [Streptomyces sp. NPDC006992]|uniref:hypothetical protein n=1 Tax=Streptomyces sp. NPDC006992 TaxID=3155601 RepID=UPI0033E7F8B3